MNKTESKKLARYARKYGHFRNGCEVYVFCPKCREKVGCEISVWDSVYKNLDSFMMDHLMYDCKVVKMIEAE